MAAAGASSVRDRLLDVDESGSSTCKRKQREATTLSDIGLAIDNKGSVLTVQPHAVWKAFALAHPELTSSLTVASARYELSGLLGSYSCSQRTTGRASGKREARQPVPRKAM